MRAWRYASCLCLLALCTTQLARAQGVATPTAPETPASETFAPVSLALQLDYSALDPESIRKAVELKLKRRVTIAGAGVEPAPALSVVVHPVRTVTVSYRTETGLIRTRSLDLPKDPARCAEVIALLADNLSRDEAAELLAALAPRAAAAPSAPAAASYSAAPIAALPSTAPARAPAPASNTRTPVSAASSSTRSGAPAPLLPRSPLNLSLYSPLALYPDSAKRSFSFELGLAYSHIGELHGAGLNLFALQTERDVRGASLATIYNRTDGTLTGAAVSAIVNQSRELNGVQISGVLNVGSGVSRGVITAGAVNWHREVNGVQVAGAFNRAERVNGVQIAGAVNVADTLRGLQIGVVNVAREVQGLQIGVVNVAKHVDGTAIGLVSIADNARLQPVLWSSTLMPINLALKFGLGFVYTQAGFGYSPSNDTYTYELGLGAHIPLGRVFIEPGVHYSEMRFSTHPVNHELLEHEHYRLSVGFDAGPVSPFIGVSILQRFAHSPDAPSSDPVKLEGFSGVAFF